MDQEEDTFTSVTWADNGNHHPNGQGSAVIQSSSNPSSPSRQRQPLTHARNASTDAHRQIGGLQTGLGAIGRSESARALSRAANDVEPPKWEGYLMVQVTDPRKELENTKEMFISYGIRAETNLAHFNKTRLTTRRRFQDFVFLREHLSRDFPACVVPPLPDKHRLEYLRGDRFGQEFLEKRSADLQLFLERVCRHPTLQRAQLLRSFLESTEWQVDMHAHNSSPTSAIDGSGNSSSILDSLSDTLLNAFTKVRKPDERFQEMREALDRFEEGLASTERVVVRNKSRTTATPLAGDLYTPGLGVDPEDLSTDYEDFASSIEGLGYLESGITKPLNQVASTMLEFAKLQRQASTRSTEAMLSHVSALISYAQAHKSTLKLRDQKQLDFEELTDYLSSVVNERDRLASLSSPYGAGHGHGGVRGAGITGYIKDRVDGWRGVDEERTRVERMQRLDGRIKELQDAVTSAHDTSLAFSNEVLREHTVFEMAKEAEMKELLTTYADGQIEMYRKAMESFDRLIPSLEQIKTDP